VTTHKIRAATVGDAPALLEIYRPFVTEAVVSFEAEPPSVDEFEARVLKALGRYAWLVAEQDGVIAGYAYGTVHRERAAYRWSAETSVYVDPRFHGHGIGRRLYEQLFGDLAARGYCNAYAGITLPNDASVALHRKVGFAPIGVFPRVGFKFGAWHDVSWWHRPLRDPAGEPPPLG
jgi:phosphinothricin acetyltransferase